MFSAVIVQARNQATPPIRTTATISVERFRKAQAAPDQSRFWCEFVVQLPCISPLCVCYPAIRISWLILLVGMEPTSQLALANPLPRERGSRSRHSNQTQRNWSAGAIA